MMRRRLVLGAAALIVAAALVVTVVGRVWLHRQDASDDSAADAQEAARTTLTAVLSYDYRSLATNIGSVKPLLTGDAEKQYDEVSAPLLTTAPKIQAITKATVKTSAVLESSERRAQVLLFVDQLSSSTSLKTPRVDQSRIVVTMKRSGRTWLVSSITAV